MQEARPPQGLKNKPRAKHEHLDPEERRKLYQDLRTGIPNAQAMRKYNLSERSVQIHRSRANQKKDQKT
jgi:FixJ family two-component response regulator